MTNSCEKFLCSFHYNRGEVVEACFLTMQGSGIPTNIGLLL